jgi:hypothetical protein
MRPYGGEMVGKIVGKGWRRWDRPTRRQIFSEVRSLMVSRFPPDFHERLPIVRRAHAQALLADRPERFASIAGTSAAAGPEAALQRLIWNTDRWVAHIEAEVTHGDGSPIRLIPMANDGWAIDSWLIPTDLAAAPYELGDILASEFDVEVVDRESGVTWYLPVELPPELVPIDGDPQGAQRLVFRGTLEIDPMTLAGGTPLPPATWDLRVRLEVLGMSRNCRVRYRPAPDAPPLAPAVFEDRLIVTPYISPKAENLGFEIVEATHVSGPTL